MERRRVDTWYLDAEGFSDFELMTLDELHPEHWGYVIAENESRMNALLRLNMTFQALMA